MKKKINLKKFCFKNDVQNSPRKRVHISCLMFCCCSIDSLCYKWMFVCGTVCLNSVCTELFSSKNTDFSSLFQMREDGLVRTVLSGCQIQRYVSRSNRRASKSNHGFVTLSNHRKGKQHNTQKTSQTAAMAELHTAFTEFLINWTNCCN